MLKTHKVIINGKEIELPVLDYHKHSCPESEGKIICISTDLLGNVYCAYCHKQVDYHVYE